MHSRPTGKDKRNNVTRLEQLVSDGIQPLLPELDEVSYISQHWNNLGMVQGGTYGPSVISSQEILAWQQLSCVSITSWEFVVIRKMSSAYIAMLSEGEKEDTKPPYGVSIDVVDRDQVEKSVRSMFRSFMAADRK